MPIMKTNQSKVNAMTKTTLSNDKDTDRATSPIRLSMINPKKFSLLEDSMSKPENII